MKNQGRARSQSCADDEKHNKCKHCQHTFKTQQALKKHLLSHLGIKQFVCTICGTGYSKKAYMETHAETHNACTKTFKAPSMLKRHLLTHSKEKPFKCPLCECSYKKERKLVNHVRQHTGESRFNCSLCEKSYLHKGSLSEHKKSPHQLTTPMSGVCLKVQKSFRSSTSSHQAAWNWKEAQLYNFSVYNLCTK